MADKEEGWETYAKECPWKDENKQHTVQFQGQTHCIAIPWQSGAPRDCCKKNCAPYHFIRLSKGN